MTNNELKEVFGIQFLREWTQMVAHVGEHYEENTPEEWAAMLINRLDEVGYCIANKQKIVMLMIGR